MPFKNCPAAEVTLHEKVVQDSLQLSGVYEEIEALCPWSIPAFTIFWASGLAREVDWNPLKNSVRDALAFGIRCTYGNPASVPARN